MSRVSPLSNNERHGNLGKKKKKKNRSTNSSSKQLDEFQAASVERGEAESGARAAPFNPNRRERRGINH